MGRPRRAIGPGLWRCRRTEAVCGVAGAALAPIWPDLGELAFLGPGRPPDPRGQKIEKKVVKKNRSVSTNMRKLWCLGPSLMFFCAF